MELSSDRQEGWFSDDEQGFLEKGGPSFPEAMLAVDRFRQVVQRGSMRIINERLADLNRAVLP
jgi:hypothetical protein